MRYSIMHIQVQGIYPAGQLSKIVGDVFCVSNQAVTALDYTIKSYSLLAVYNIFLDNGARSIR